MVIEGMDVVMKNLNMQIARIQKNTLVGLIKGAEAVLRDTELTPPLTPVDLGNLRGSRFVYPSKIGEFSTQVTSGLQFRGPQAQMLRYEHNAVMNDAISETSGNTDNKFCVVFGYSAFYAQKVHQSIGTNFKRPGSGAYFLQASLRRNTSKVLKIIRKEAGVK